MNRIFLFFIYTASLALLLPPLFPHLRLLFFAPLLIMVYYQKDRLFSLWFALLCGLMVDLLSSQTRLGVYALNYCLTTLFLYSYKQNFFADRLTTIPIMTYLFACITTLIQVGLLYMFGQGFTLSLKWIYLDLVWMPAMDALYAGIAFTLPNLFLPKIPVKKRTVLFTPAGTR